MGRIYGELKNHESYGNFRWIIHERIVIMKYYSAKLYPIG